MHFVPHEVLDLKRLAEGSTRNKAKWDGFGHLISYTANAI